MSIPACLLVSSCAAALVLFTACGGGNTSPAGHYTLDHDAFVPEAIATMVEQGQIPDTARQLADTMLRKIVFQVDLAEDGTFSANMSVPGPMGFQRASYTGLWSQRGELITLMQTHENGEEKTDTMNGKVTSDALHLEHMEAGRKMAYVLRREGIPASPR